MYAIIRAGGKQAKVREGDVLDVEKLRGSETVTFTPLLVVTEEGKVISDRTTLEKASVTAEILGEDRGPKIDIFKYKPKTGYRRRSGHRQTYTRIQVTKIDTPGGKKTAKKGTTKKAVEDTEAAAADEEA